MSDASKKDVDPIDTDLFWFSEWLDSEGLMREPIDGETEDDRSHEQLVRDFLAADERGEAGRSVPRGER